MDRLDIRILCVHGETGPTAPATPATPPQPAVAPATAAVWPGRPSALLDTRVVYCGDNLEQLAKLPDACVDLV